MVYTDLDGAQSTDTAAFIDAINEDGIMSETTDAGGKTYRYRREFGLRRSAVPSPKINAHLRVPSEGDDDWTITQFIGSDTARFYLLAERLMAHERSRAGLRGG